MENCITNIKIQKKNKERVDIYIDGEYRLSCSAELVYKYGIKTGMENLVELSSIISEDNYIKCKEKSLKFIERAFKTKKEVINKLESKGYDEKTINRVISFLIQYELINDNKYAELYINEKKKSYSRNKIKFVLKNKGIDEEIIQEKLQQNYDYEFEIEAAFLMGQKKFKSLTNKNEEKRIICKKIYDLLARNGYSYNTINTVINKLLNTESIDGEGDF